MYLLPLDVIMPQKGEFKTLQADPDYTWLIILAVVLLLAVSVAVIGLVLRKKKLSQKPASENTDPGEEKTE